MSSDFSWLRRDCKQAPKARKREEVTAEDVQNLRNAAARQDGHAVLHYLRVCSPAMPSTILVAMRTEAYNDVGLPEHAAEFEKLLMPVGMS
jgi:hypothetical protein